MKIVTAAFLALTILSAPAHAEPKLFGSTGLDPEFCNQKALRQTVVYIDDMMMIDGRTDWAHKISGKLKATLTPGERVAVVRLSPEKGQSSEIWSGCWPSYSPAQQDDIKKKNYFFSKNPIATLPEQQAFFMRDFGNALTAIYGASKKAEAGAASSNATHPKKQIIRALSLDDNRYASSSTTIRAIIYSDMLENSDLGSVFDPLPTTFPDYGQKLGSRFRKGVFYAFGFEGGDGSAVAAEKAKTFWVEALKGMSSVLSGFGSDLNITNAIPVDAATYDVHFKLNNEALDGKLSLLSDADGNIVDSWLGFNRLSITGVSGSFSCKEDACKLDGSTTTSLATTSPSEALKLVGTRKSMSGDFGVSQTGMMFPLKAELSSK